MNSPKAAQVLQMEVEELLALERGIKQALDGQCEDDRGAAIPEVAMVLRELAVSTDARVSAMDSLARSLGVGRGTLSKIAAVEGRDCRISRRLRDDHHALSRAATAYSILLTTASALREARIASVAQRHLHEVTPLIMTLREAIPVVIVQELGAEFPNLDPTAVQYARTAAQEAWAEAHPSTV